MPRNADYLVSRADVTLSTAEDGEVRVNTGDKATGIGYAQDVSMWGLPGFISMPDAPDGDGACEVLCLADGFQTYAIAGRDNRYASKVGNFQPGDRGIVGNCDARVLLKKASNSVTLYTENGKALGVSMAMTLNGSTGEAMLINGGAIIKASHDEIVLSVGGTALVMNQDGLQIFGKHCAINTGSGNLGVLGNVPPPVGIMSVLAGPSGIMGAPSTRWTVALVFLLWMARAAWEFGARS